MAKNIPLNRLLVKKLENGKVKFIVSVTIVPGGKSTKKEIIENKQNNIKKPH